MWILDSEGDFLGGKRVWLRPGKKYLFGRVRQGGASHAIDDRSISRKHVVIEISSVKPGDGSHLYTKSEISVTDQGSKCGTTVDGGHIRGTTTSLSGDEHTIKLGKYEHALRIKWEPVVFSFSFSSKELRSKDPLAQVRSRLEDLDIKTIIPYVVDQTTHVVQNKRNTAKGLQALVNGRYIVQDSYLDAVVYAATPSDLENLESLSPLESDFDSAWPDATEHLPPAGKEPVNRPAEAFAPNPHRSNIFEGYTFVFGDPVQFENLQAPITNAHGKALHYEVENGVTTADDIVRYMRNAAGNKDLRARDGPGVVLVRFRAKGRYEAWSLDISDQVALATDQRVIEQREFLDAILGNDASPLCRSLPTEPAENADERDAEPTPVGQSQQQSQPEPPQPEQSQSQASESSQPRSRARSRARFVSKMKAFDDGFDMQSVPVDIPEDPEPSADTPQTQEQTPIEEDVVSDLLPGATAMKRRRAEAEGRKDTYSRMEEEPTPKPKRQKLNVREAARQHREAEEDAQRERQQAEHAALEDSGVEKLKDLAIVEEMDVPVRASQAAEDNRWDERWNGRKNFKKFRRKGDSGHSRHRLQAVIVPLEEVTRKEIGIGEHTWVTNQNQSPESSPRPQDTMSEEPAPRFQSSRVESQSSTARRSQKRAREVPDSDSEEELRFRFRRRR